MRQSYDKPAVADLPVARSLTSSFLCLWVYWQPDANAPNPNMPGLKHKVWMETPVKGHEPCLCGSGRLFRHCCRLQTYIPTTCPNPSLDGYSVLREHTARFDLHSSGAIRQYLHEDMRLQCVEDTPARSFWLAWGVPARESRYGIVSFGDIELRDQHTLLITAFSALRLQWMLSIVADVLPPGVANPTLTTGPVQWIDKRTGLPATQEPGPPPGLPGSTSGNPSSRPKK